MSINKQKALEELELFIFHIDDWVEELIEKAENQGFRLDFSQESLKDLAVFVRKNNIINNRENINDFANCWIYLGEVFRKMAKNAYWTVGTEDKRNMNYGLYYLTGYDNEMSEFIPVLYLNNFTLSTEDELDNNFFYRLVEFKLNPIIPNLDYLPTEEDD